MSDLVKRLRDAASSPARNTMGIGEHWNLEDEAADAIERKDAAIAELVEAGRAVVDRWDSPLWKDLPHTGEFIARLRDVVAKYDIPKDEL